MKPQDLIFIVLLLFLLFKHDPKWAVIFGLSLLVLSIPLFATWTFFTAERLTWYAGGFFLTAIIFSMLKSKNEQ